MVKFEGERSLPLPPAELWPRLTDPAFLVRCLPDVERVDRVDAGGATLVIRPGFHFARGTLDSELRVEGAVEGVSARIVVRSKGIGSTAEVETGFVLAPVEGGSRVRWTAAVTSLTGVLKMAPAGLVRGAAQAVIERIWTSIQDHLTSTGA